MGSVTVFGNTVRDSRLRGNDGRGGRRRPYPLILNLLKDGQRRRERPDGTEWRRVILQQVQDERISGFPLTRE